MMRFTSIVIFILLMNAGDLPGEEPVIHELKGVEYFIRLSAIKHPDIEMMRLKRKQLAAGKKTASQIPNPDFNSRLLFDFDTHGTGGEYGITQTFETGGKRSARIAKADSELTLFDKSYLLLKQNIAKDIVLTIHRLRQIGEEMQTIRRTVATYYALLEGLKKVPALNPVQSANSAVYQLAIRESNELLRHLRTEEITVLSGLEWSIGEELSIADIQLPKKIAVWPAVEERFEISGPLMDLAAAEKELSIAEFKIAESGIWPDLKAGPVMVHTPTGGNASYGAGITLSVTLPIFHRNSGQVESAEMNVKFSEMNERIKEKKILRLRSLYLKTYRHLTEKMPEKFTPEADSHMRKKIHSLMNRGLLPASLAVEYNRQEIDLQKAYHSGELKALNCLWFIYAIDGIIFREATREK